jgi:hypothetical protein
MKSSFVNSDRSKPQSHQESKRPRIHALATYDKRGIKNMIRAGAIHDKNSKINVSPNAGTKHN